MDSIRRSRARWSGTANGTWPRRRIPCASAASARASNTVASRWEYTFTHRQPSVASWEISGIGGGGLGDQLGVGPRGARPIDPGRGGLDGGGHGAVRHECRSVLEQARISPQVSHRGDALVDVAAPAPSAGRARANPPGPAAASSRRRRPTALRRAEGPSVRAHRHDPIHRHEHRPARREGAGGRFEDGRVDEGDAPRLEHRTEGEHLGPPAGPSVGRGRGHRDAEQPAPRRSRTATTAGRARSIEASAPAE